jgi:GTP cyclohydrolase I
MTHSLALAAEPPSPSPAEQAAADFLTALGVDLDDESRRDTPRRMAAMYAELLTPADFHATTFPNDGGYDELVVARDIPFHSLCEHHLLPFSGVAHVGYIPASGSSGSRSSPAWSIASPARCRSRSG